MSVLERVIRDLQDIEAELQDRPAVAQRVQTVARLLGGDEAQWIGTTTAKKLLGVRSENTVKAWARLGVLRSRREPNGRTKVSLADVLERRAINADLVGSADDRELSPEEHAILARPTSQEDRERLNQGLAALGVPPLAR